MLTTGVDNTSTTFSGTIQDGTGTFFLTKAGTGTLTLTGDNTYSGGTTISAGTLELGNANSASSGRITFGPSAHATLKLDSSTMPTNTIYGVTFGDIIDLAGVRYEPGATVSLNTSTNMLSVSVGTSSYQLQLDPAQSFSDGYFQATQDRGTGTQIEEVSCFLPGTLIRTPSGDVAVETMRRGDLVVLTDGRGVAIAWVGRQTVSTRFGDPLRVLPIRIKAGALGEDVPRRDLLVSPDHALLVHGVLIQAGALVNGISILREYNVPERFTYYHVELEEHALIFAENTAAETFVDNRDRLAFDNWSEHDALYPDGKPIAELPYPRAKSYRQVPRAIRERLAEHGERIYEGKIREVA